MEIRAITWNLFHGRDKPPDPDLFSWRGRLLRSPQSNATHIQVNRDLTREFSGVLAAAEWDVALLQEAPPRFREPLAAACDAESHRALTSRNSLSSLRRSLAVRNPDLIASGEGGSNLTLVRSRGALGEITERRELTLRERKPERRTMAFTRTSSGICVANLHTSNDRPDLAAPELAIAANTAVTWAGDAPLVFGGDMNLRPGDHPQPFADLETRFGLVQITGPRAIDHVLARGLEILQPPRACPPEAREVPEDGLAIRLSDHAPVSAVFTRR